MKQFEDGDPCFAPMLNALFAAFRGTAVMDGCEASATGTSRAVSITAGSAQVNGVEVAVGAGSVTLDAGGSFDRYDLISVNAAGSKIVTKGVAKRKCPPQPTGTCLLAIVFVPAGATVIATGNVYDARLLASQLAVASISGQVFAPLLTDMTFIHRPDSSRIAANQVYQDLTEFSTASTSYVLAKTFPALPATGFAADADSKITVQCDLSAWGGDSTPCYVDFRVGGESRAVLGSNYVHYTYHTKWINVPVNPGEVIEVWFKSGNPNGSSKIKNVKVFSLREIYRVRPVAW